MKTALVLCLATLARPLAAQDTTSARAQDTSGVQVRNDSISLRFVDADLRGVVQVLGGYLDRPAMVSNLPGARVSLETPHPVPRAELAHLLDGLLQSNGLELVAEQAWEEEWHDPIVDDIVELTTERARGLGYEVEY